VSRKRSRGPHGSSGGGGSSRTAVAAAAAAAAEQRQQEQQQMQQRTRDDGAAGDARGLAKVPWTCTTRSMPAAASSVSTFCV